MIDSHSPLFLSPENKKDPDESVFKERKALLLF